MKVIISLALLVLSGGICAAQTPAGGNAAPGVSVIESNWRRLLVRNPALDQDPLRPLEAQARSERIRAGINEQNRIRASMGKDQIMPPARNATVDLSGPRRSYPYEYVYRVKVANTGLKKIRGLVWEYVFVDESTGKEVGRHQFTSKVSISPGSSKRVFGHSIVPPTSSIDAQKAGQEPEGQHSERVLITKIYYDDDSVWERAIE